jgi:hypothetical protein
MTASRPGRGPSARQLVGAVAVATALPILGGCQDALSVGVLNQCGDTIQADAASYPSSHEEDPEWTTVGPSERDGVRLIDNKPERVYLWVRAEGGVARQFDVPVADLPKPPEGAGYDVEVLLASDRCPTAEG